MITEIGPVIPPAVVPAEPTTPIRPSEALRLGRLIRPRRVEGQTWSGADGACAIGAMAAGYGITGRDLTAGVVLRFETFSADGFGLTASTVVHNDYDHWSDDQIVAWLESLGL